MTAQETATRIATIYGGTNAAARAIGINRASLSRIISGQVQAGGSLEAHLARALRQAEEAQE